MSYYRYKGVDARGRMKKGKMSASNGADLEIRLRKMGLELISYKTARSPGLRLPLRRVKKRDLILFCFHLEQTLRAGVSILESLQDLRDSADNPRLREVCASMLESIEGGKTLSEAMREFPDAFSEVFINLIRAGEQTGDLGSILDRLGANLKWQDEQASMAGKLIIYPVFTGTVISAVVFFLMTYLVPELLAFVRTTGSELPAPYRIVDYSIRGVYRLSVSYSVCPAVACHSRSYRRPNQPRIPACSGSVQVICAAGWPGAGEADPGAALRAVCHDVYIRHHGYRLHQRR